jgi:hypothetical protein
MKYFGTLNVLYNVYIDSGKIFVFCPFCRLEPLLHKENAPDKKNEKRERNGQSCLKNSKGLLFLMKC